MTETFSSRVASKVWIGILLCAGLALPGTAAAGPRIGLGAGVGIDWPRSEPSLLPGGVWRFSLDYSVSESFSLAMELGAAENDTDVRVVYVGGAWYHSRLHGVTTLAMIGRYAPQSGAVRPYLAFGPSYYFSWDELQPTPTVSGTEGQYGFGIVIGAGSSFRVWSRLDLFAEGDYHYATDSEDDARFVMVQAGLRFYLGPERLSSGEAEAVP